MKNTQLTVSEIIQLSTELGSFGYKTIDQFLFKKFGFDYHELPFYNDLKTTLETIMERIEIQNPNGYIEYHWVDK